MKTRIIKIISNSYFKCVYLFISAYKLMGGRT